MSTVAEGAPIAAVLNELLRLIRGAASHGADHPLVAQIAEDCARALEAAQPPFALQLVAKAAFRDGRLVPLDLEDHQKALALASYLELHSTHELRFQPGVKPAALVELARRAAATDQEPLEDLKVEGLKARYIEAGRRGEHTESLDPDVYAAAQLALAMTDVEALVRDADEPWVLRRGLAVVRRVELAWEKAGWRAGALIERVPGEWTLARRALAACWHVGAATVTLEIGRSLRRAMVHATLLLAVHGYQSREGRGVILAAERSSRALADAPLRRSGVDPHRQRLATLLHSLTRAEPFAAAELVSLGYEVERLRCPEGADFDLSLAEIFSHIVAAMGTTYDARWVRLLVQIFGAFPVGSAVKTADGRTGVVIGPGTEPGKPLLLMEGVPYTPSVPVSPLRTTP